MPGGQCYLVVQTSYLENVTPSFKFCHAIFNEKPRHQLLTVSVLVFLTWNGRDVTEGSDERKNEAAKLLQQFSGTLRFGKRRLHLQTV